MVDLYTVWHRHAVYRCELNMVSYPSSLVYSAWYPSSLVYSAWYPSSLVYSAWCPSSRVYSAWCPSSLVCVNKHGLECGNGHAYRHMCMYVYRHVYEHMCTYVYGHVYGHVYGRV